MSQEFDLIIRADAALVDGGWRPAAVAVRDGRIAAIGAGEENWRAQQDVRLAADERLIPGLVDTHVHVNEPGRTQWEGFATATAAAAAGGVTTIVDMPLNSIPPTTTPEALELKRDAAAPQAAVDVGFWGGAIPASLGHLRELHQAGVFGFKAFLSPSGVDEFPHLSREQLFAALAEVASFNGMLIVHAEDPGELDAHPHAGGARYADFVDSRPDQAEVAAIETVILGVRATGARTHILHLSSAAALPAIRAAKDAGLPLTVETCPHYLSLDAEHIPEGATAFKCCPPIRDRANQDQLWEALLDGTIDLIASDHSPATAELKLDPQGDFAAAWGGISGLQVSLAAVWSAAKERGIPLEHVVTLMSRAPARLVGLERKGRIAVGADADLVAFAPDHEFRVAAGELRHRNAVSAFDGALLHGRVRGTWLRGGRIHPAAENALPDGRLLSRP